MTKKKSGNTRSTGKEQYYTLPEVVDLCVETAMRYRLPGQRILEPAGGTGEFIEGMLRAGVCAEQITATDIEPKHDLVKRGDFLESSFDIDFDNQFFTLTNPPFGRANSLSVPFFNHAAPVSNYIGFLIPVSWRRWSVMDRLDQRFHLVEDVEMPQVSFYNFDDGGNVLPYDGGLLKTCFQLWERRNYPRTLIAKNVEDRQYIVSCSPQEADVAITFFGHRSGRVETDFERKLNTTKNFFKVKDQGVVAALNSIDYTRFNKNNAYVASLSKPEINFLLNEYYDSL